MPKNTAASVRQRLLNLARECHEDFDYVLRQYVMQRLLYRLSISHYAGQFLLKGALLFWIWNEAFHRPTRDIDLLSFGDHDVPYLVKVFREIISVPTDDGLVFDIGAVTGVEIKEGADYPGVRLTGFALWQAFLGKKSIEDASSFIEVMQDLQRFLEPVYQAIADERPYPYQWSQGEFKWMGA